MQADELEETKRDYVGNFVCHKWETTPRRGDNFKCENFLSFMWQVLIAALFEELIDSVFFLLCIDST